MNSNGNDAILWDIQDKMLKALQDNSFDSLLKTSQEIFDAPIVITNENYERLGLSPETKIGDDVYDQLVDSGEMDRDLLENFLKSYLKDKDRNFKPFYVTDKPKLGVEQFIPRIFAIIRDENRLYAHLGILIPEDKFEAWQIHVADLLSKFFLTYFKLQDLKLDKDWELNQINLIELISKESSFRKKLDAYNRLKNTFSKPWSLLLINISQSMNLETYSRVLIKDLRKRYSNILFLIYGDYLYCLEEKAKDDLLMKEIALYMKDQGYSFIVYFGENINKDYIENSSWLADLLLAYIKENRDQRQIIYKIQDYMTEMASQYFKDKKKSFLFIHPGLTDMQVHDQINGTEYYKSMVTYYKTGLDKSKTCQSLHIHRNTLAYRFSRMKELFDIDLDKENDLLHILMSIWILE